MSYSIHASGANKEAAWEDAKAKVLAALNGQTAHDSDRDVIIYTIGSFLGAASDDAAMDYVIAAYGDAGGEWTEGVLTKLTSVSCTVKVTLVPRAKP